MKRSPTYEDFKNQIYKARLEKVLAKFEDEEENNIKFIDLFNKVDIVYYDSIFSLGTYYYVDHEDRTTLSLNTVESLIKDMEANNE